MRDPIFELIEQAKAAEQEYEAVAMRPLRRRDREAAHQEFLAAGTAESRARHAVAEAIPVTPSGRKAKIVWLLNWIPADGADVGEEGKHMLRIGIASLSVRKMPRSSRTRSKQ